MIKDTGDRSAKKCLLTYRDKKILHFLTFKIKNDNDNVSLEPSFSLSLNVYFLYLTLTYLQLTISNFRFSCKIRDNSLRALARWFDIFKNDRH